MFNDPSWDLGGSDVANARKDAGLVATFMNSTNPNLDAFKAKGRKLIVWHGWSDAALTALGSIECYEEVRKRDDGVRDYFRLFLMPGVLHYLDAEVDHRDRDAHGEGVADGIHGTGCSSVPCDSLTHAHVLRPATTQVNGDSAAGLFARASLHFKGAASTSDATMLRS